MNEEPPSALSALADRLGIQAEFQNAHGDMVRTDELTKRTLLNALGLPVDDEASARACLHDLDVAEWGRPLQPITVIYPAQQPFVDLMLPSDTTTLHWELELENEHKLAGEAEFMALPLRAKKAIDGILLERRRLPLPRNLPLGYHRLRVEPSGSEMTVIASPGRCWLPPALEAGSRSRIWGVAAQLYLLRSKSDWGIGDFANLAELVAFGATHGADVIGLNPLHAMFHDKPGHASPYSPASRLLLNVLNIDVPAVVDRFRSASAQALISSRDFAAALQSCRAARLVDYTHVAGLKLSALEAVFESGVGARSDKDFKSFRERGGVVLQNHCLFLALHEKFAVLAPDPSNWRSWPIEFRQIGSAAVGRFATDNSSRVEFLAWLQWLADDQLRAAADAAREQGMAIGLYRDLAIGADPAGAESWINPDIIVSAAHVGVPPDIHNPAGQDWGLPPLHPIRLREQGYRSFIELVRANMRHAGGLRIDHVVGLQQLYWIPEGSGPAAGAYVKNPVDDLIGILALESHRHQCLVVGEDLGTVPNGFRERLADANILSYRVLFFEQESETGNYLTPDEYPFLALAVIGSHDLPTFRGWWEGRDISLKQSLGLYPSQAEFLHQQDSRERDKAALLKALRLTGLLSTGTEPSIEHLVEAVHMFLARTSSALAMVQIDDLTGEVEQVNVPATSEENPNWRRRLALTTEELSSDKGSMRLVKIFSSERPKPQVK